MLRIGAAYGATVVVFLALDALWLALAALQFYRREVGPLLLDKPNLGIAAVFYLIYVAAIVALAILPALNGGSWINALVSGAILGLAAYGTYDITNLSTMKGWSLPLTLVDLSWGTVLTAVAATVGYLIASLVPA